MQRGLFDAVEAAPSVLAVLRQTGLPQRAQMLRHGGLCRRTGGHQVGDRAFAVAQQFQHATAGRVCQRPEDRITVGVAVRTNDAVPPTHGDKDKPHLMDSSGRPDGATYDEAVHAVTRALVLATGVALLGAACSEEQLPVETAPVGRVTVTEVVEAPATVVARGSVTVTAPADGRVAGIRVRDGQRVRAGAVLLRLESPSAQQRLRQARAADARAAASGVSIPGIDVSAEQADADAAAEEGFSRARKAARLLRNDEARREALAAVERAQAQYVAARSQAAAAVESFNAGVGGLAEALSSLSQAQRVQTGAAVEAAERTVKALEVVAPISGRVSFERTAGQSGGADVSGLVDQLPAQAQSQADQLLGGGGGGGSEGPLAAGVPVDSGDQLLTVTDISTLSLRAEVDETDVLLVERGVRADVELDAVPGATYRARVASVDLSPTVSDRGGVTYVVRLRLSGGTMAAISGHGRPAPRPRPGMSAVADLKVRTAENAVAVPASAVVRDGSTDAVWVVKSGRVERRTVRLGAEGEANVQVIEGVQPGDSVVVKGADRVREGQQLE